jgi:hypothetical protein
MEAAPSLSGWGKTRGSAPMGRRRRAAPRSAARPLSAVWGTRYVGPVNKPSTVPHLEAVEKLARVLLKSASGFWVRASGPDFRNVTPSILRLA